MKSMSSQTTLLSVSEYLGASYRPDRDYVDGELVERNVGEWNHSRLQALLLKQLLEYEDALGFLTVPEQRVQVKASRFRVPDLCVVRGNPGAQVLRQPPLICVEILSPEDTMSSMQERIDDYVAFGIADVWIFDPRRHTAYWADKSGVHQALGDVLTAAAVPVRIDLAELWARLEQ
jgi:Uma2 family endonuclease